MNKNYCYVVITLITLPFKLFYYFNNFLLLTIPLHSFITIVVMEFVYILLFILKYSLWVVFVLLYNIFIAVGCEAPQTIVDVALYEIKYDYAIMIKLIVSCRS